MGVFTISVSFGMLTYGPAYVTGPEVALCMLLETVLGPVWVFLEGFEKPPALTVVGGVILVSALAVNKLVYP
jgi:drug/metabolite transporter (DMT)-like permease